jgi:putative transposase
MKRTSFSGYRFPPAIIQRAIWLYPRIRLSLRDVEDLLAERGIVVSYESISALDRVFRADDRSGLV